jgi:hypothetical protein
MQRILRGIIRDLGAEHTRIKSCSLSNSELDDSTRYLLMHKILPLPAAAGCMVTKQRHLSARPSEPATLGPAASMSLNRTAMGGRLHGDEAAAS